MGHDLKKSPTRTISESTISLLNDVQPSFSFHLLVSKSFSVVLTSLSIKAITQIMSLCEENGVTQIQGIATAAYREASNGIGLCFSSRFVASCSLYVSFLIV